MTKEELAEEWVEKEYDELKYEKCERKDFVFTFYELKEMGKQAYIAGARPLEATNKKISDECHKLVDTLEKKQNENVDLLGKIAFTENALNNEKAKVAELEAQIENMKNCKNCANYMISGKCPSFFRTGWCKNWEMTRKEYLERTIDFDDAIIRIVRLEKENAELKEQHKMVCENLTNTHRHIREQLTKAKELLKKWVELFKPKGSNIPPTPIQIATEQFLSEVEK